jgi:glycosyltransferase involved in cell wall biosynthesis
MFKEPMIHASFIVPVHNAEQSLRRCLDSLRAIRKYSIEIILVENGSSDGSRMLCQKLASGDSRIRVAELTDAGVSRARNKGIEMALGRYIGFVDADDWINPSVIESILGETMASEAAMYVFNYRVVSPLGKSKKSKPRVWSSYGRRLYAGSSTKGIEITSDGWLRSVMSTRGVKGFCWNKLYRFDLFKHARFDEGLKYLEDLEFNVDISAALKSDSLAKGIIYINQCGYNYLQRADSVVHTPGSNFEYLKGLEVVGSKLDGKASEIDSYLVFSAKNRFIVKNENLSGKYYDEWAGFSKFPKRLISRVFDQPKRQVLINLIAIILIKNKLSNLYNLYCIILNKLFN